MKKLILSAAAVALIAGLAVVGWRFSQRSAGKAEESANNSPKNGSSANGNQPAELNRELIDGHAIELPPALPPSADGQTGIVPAGGADAFKMPPGPIQPATRSESSAPAESGPTFTLPPSK